MIFRNRATDHFRDRYSLQIELEGISPNTQAVGTQISAWHDSKLWYIEQQPVRGFQSSVDPVLHLGLGDNIKTLDSLVVHWPNGATSLHEAVATNRRLQLQEPPASPHTNHCLLYTSPSPRDRTRSRMPSSA